LIVATSKRQSAPEQIFTTTTTYNALGLVWKETDAGGAEVTHEYVGGSFKLRSTMTAPQVSLLSEVESVTTTTLDPDTAAGIPEAPVIRTREKLPHGVLRDTDTDARNGRLLRIFTTGLGRALSNPLQDLRYHWDENGNLKIRKDAVAGKIETFNYDNLDRLDDSTIQGQSLVNYSYDPNGNLRTKGNTSLDYHDGGVSYRVASAKVKGATTPNRTYAYDDAGHVTGDGKRDYTWTSFGQLATVEQTSAPALDRFAATGAYAPEIPGIASIQLHLQSQALATFAFDASGSRSQQVLVRDFADSSAARVITRYLGSFEIEEHATKPVSGSGFTTTRILHRHRLGSALLTVGPDGLGGPTLTRLAVILTDHIGSTDVIVRADLDPATGTWKTASAHPRAERQSFDAWGDRRNAATWSELRPTDGANRQTSAMDYDRGFTGHEMLDDFGLIHMNGRIYDPEIGRFLSPDPYVQVPEYSQNFNRYTYVLNNPLSYTDSSGHFIDWIGAAVVAIYNAVVTYAAAVTVAYTTGGFIAAAGAAVGGLIAPGLSGLILAGGGSAFAIAGVGAQLAVGLYSIGSTIAAGGSAGDVLLGIAVNFVSGAIASGGAVDGTGGLHELGEMAGDAWQKAKSIEGVARATSLTVKHVAGHAVLGGLSQEALGGRFQDGFLSAGTSTLMMDAGLGGMFQGEGPGAMLGRTAVASVVGGTATEIGGGKFANGAMTAAWQHLLNAELGKISTEGAREAVSTNAIEDASYSLDGKGPDGRWVAGQHKCNAYVFDVLEDSGFRPRLEPAQNGRRVPDAGHWTDPKVSIAAYRGKKLIGYWKITNDPKAGDVVAIKLEGEGQVQRFSGHVGIVKSRPTPESGGMQKVIASYRDGAYISSKEQLNNTRLNLVYRNFIPK
jgi:RHS repeat-associated protein